MTKITKENNKHLEKSLACTKNKIIIKALVNYWYREF